MDIKLPNLGDGIESAVVIGVLVAPGDTVEVDQSVLELETDKAIAPVPATSAGVVKSILVKEGDTVRTGQIVVSLEGGNDDASPAPAEPVAAQPVMAAPVHIQQQQPVLPVQMSPTTITGYQYQSPSGALPPAAPSIKKIARDLGLDLTRIKGSERGGRIVLADLRGYIQTLQQLANQAMAAPVGAEPVPQKPALKSIDFSKWGPVKKEALSMLRKKIGEKMHQSWTTVPHVTQFGDVDITDLMALRKQYKPKFEKKSASLTMTVFTLKAVVDALKKFPGFNASYDDAAQELVYKNYYHIGVAVDTENGLIVPVIRDVDKKSLLELSLELSVLAEKARKRTLKIEELQGGTFTISNLGGLGGSSFTPIVNHPEVAILALSRAEKKPVIREDKVVPKLIMPISVSYDHRVIDGADGARFTCAVIDSIQNFEEAAIKESLKS